MNDQIEVISDTYSDIESVGTSITTPVQTNTSKKLFQLQLKDLTDKMLAGLAIILLSPIFLITALLIKLETRGPTFYSQLRGGKNGEAFTILKFRTMTHEACESGSTEHATPQDPRMTRMGKILRKTSIDELPQLINVLRGDMALVGPRPHMLEHDALYSREVIGYQRRFRMKPGITGLAQVNGRRGMIYHANHMQSRINDDNAYINQWSYMDDIKILAKTPWIVITGKNAH